MLPAQIELFWKVIENFQQEKLLEHVMLIGSWTEFIYEQSGCLSGFMASSRTYDLDFLIRNKHKQFNPKKDLCALITDIGFSANFHQDGFIKFDYYEEGTSLYIEFLISDQRPTLEPRQLLQYGIVAEVLPMDILVKHIIEVEINNYKLIVPSPSAYVLHKMIINSKRSFDKREKDQLAIENTLSAIRLNLVLMRELQLIYEGLTKKEKRKIDEYTESHFIELF